MRRSYQLIKERVLEFQIIMSHSKTAQRNTIYFNQTTPALLQYEWLLLGVLQKLFYTYTWKNISNHLQCEMASFFLNFPDVRLDKSPMSCYTFNSPIKSSLRGGRSAAGPTLLVGIGFFLVASLSMPAGWLGIQQLFRDELFESLLDDCQPVGLT